LTLKARKLGGAEGFQIPFRVRDKDNFLMLNLGGWANSLFAIERCSNGSKAKLEPSYPGYIETNRWYDIRIDIKGSGFKCYLDGKQVLAMDDAAGDYTRPLMTANANLAEKTGKVVLKVVNYSPKQQKTTVKLNGAGAVVSEGTSETLSSASQEDENTVDEPQKIVPVTKTVKGLGRKFNYTFPPNSLTVLRIKAEIIGK
jgi:alpha-L-arabinofuranosidase